MSEKWRREHPQRDREMKRRWDRAHPEVKREWMRKFRRDHPGRAAAYRAASREKKNHRAALTRLERRRAVLAFLGNACVRCGFNDDRALQFDHVNSDGYLERKTGRQSATYYSLAMRRDPEAFKAKYQLLCANCNQIKTVELGEHGPKPKEQQKPVNGQILAQARLQLEAEAEIGFA